MKTVQIKMQPGWFRDTRVAFIFNDAGEVVARVREGAVGFGGRYDNVYRLYDPPVLIQDAISHSNNFSKRSEVAGTFEDAIKFVEDKLNMKKGVVVVKKTQKTQKMPKNVVKTEGPHGSTRYKNIITGKFVKTPA